MHKKLRKIPNNMEDAYNVGDDVVKAGNKFDLSIQGKHTKGKMPKAFKGY